jgi:hypothetical protein
MKKFKPPKIDIKIPVTKLSIKQVTVTAADIKKGKKNDSEYCPLACAIRRQLGKKAKDFDINVGGSKPTIYWHGLSELEIPVFINGKQRDTYYFDSLDDTSTELNLGAEADAFVEAFDSGKPVKPQTFKNRAVK